MEYGAIPPAGHRGKKSLPGWFFGNNIFFLNDTQETSSIQKKFAVLFSLGEIRLFPFSSDIGDQNDSLQIPGLSLMSQPNLPLPPPRGGYRLA